MLPFHLWVMLVGGIYQALGHAVGSTIVGLSRQVIFFIPCVIVMNLIAGEYGLASAQAVSDILGMLIGVPMFIHIRKYVNKEKEKYFATLSGEELEKAKAYSEG